jgi:hypothetical protein
MAWFRLIALVVSMTVIASGPVSAAPSVRSEGVVRWNVKWQQGWNRGFDLDSARTTTSTSSMELWLVFSSYPPPGGMWVFGASTANGARFRAWNGRPGYAACKANRTWDEAAGPTTDPDGTWFCMKTTGSRVARLRVLHWPTKAERFFKFRYLVWQRN